MKINYYSLFLIFCCCFLFACKSDKKPAPVPAASNAPKVIPPKQGAQPAPSNISHPDKMANNFQRMQGEWQKLDNSGDEVQVRGKTFLEITGGANRAELANQFKVVKNCEGVIDLNGEFFMVGTRCFKLLKISVEEMEVEDMEQQRVEKYSRI